MRITRPRGLRAAATGAVALVLAAGASVAALAAVSPTPTVAANGNAGYNATIDLTSTPGGFTDVQGVVDPNQYALTIKSGAQGAQLCNSTTDYGAQVGLASDNLTTVFSVEHAIGTIPSPGCPTGGVIPGAVAFPGLDAVPYGHHVWVDEYLAEKTVRVRVLLCYAPGHEPAPPVSPSPSPTGTETTTPPPSPSPSVSTSGTGTPSPTVSPSATGTATATSTATTTALVTRTGNPHHGWVPYVCVWRTFTVTRQVVVFQAQDLDALASGAPAGDQPGVQIAYVHVPHGTVFDEAGDGVSENLTGLVACTGLAADGNTYPLTLPGPAAYTSAACQPVSVFSYATATPAGGTATDFQTLDSVEGISPSATGALVAPNNSITPTSTGEHGTASDASTTGSTFQINTANAPTS